MKKIILFLLLSVQLFAQTGKPQAIDNMATPLFKGLILRKQTLIPTPTLGIMVGNVANRIVSKDSLGVLTQYATTVELNAKQNQLNGTGFVKANGTTISYDTTTYLTRPVANTIYASLAGNNNFTGSNLFLTPIFANSTSTSSFSSITGAWSNTGNLGTFSFRYNTKVGANTVTWNPIRMDANGWVGIGMNPTQAFEVLGAAKFNSNISATTIMATGTITGSNLSGTNTGDNAVNSNYSGLATSKQDVLNGTGFVKSNAGVISYDNNTYLTTTSASSIYAPITSPVFVTDATTPRLKISGAGDVGKGSDLVMGGNNNDLTIHGTGKVILGTGGFQRLVVTNAGNVGVGTVAPTAKFEVSGLAGLRYNDGKQADGKYLRSNSTGVAAWDSVKVSEVFGLNTALNSKQNQLNGTGFVKSAAGVISYDTTTYLSTTDAATLGYLPIDNPTATGTLTAPVISNSGGANLATSSAGRVGIGTTSPATKFHLYSTNNAVSQIESGGFMGFAYTRYKTLDFLGTSSIIYDHGVNITGSGSYDLYDRSNSDRVDTYMPNGSRTLYTRDTARVTILNNGNVGIGTTSPTQKLEVSNAGETNIRIWNTLVNSWDLRNTAPNGNFQLVRGGSNVFFNIANNGNVGIGTVVDAGYKLSIDGNIRATNIYHAVSPSAIAQPLARYETTGTGGRPYIEFKAENADYGYMGWGSTASNIMFMMNYLNSDLQFGTNSTIRMALKGNGSIGMGTTSTDNSAILHISSTNKGVLFPRLTTTQINSIVSPADGLTVYNTDLKTICFYDGGALVWRRVSHSAM